MPSRPQEYPARTSSSSSRDMEGQPRANPPSLGSQATSDSAARLPPDHREMGLATYSHDRGHELATRSFLFRDDQVRSIAFNRGHPPDRDQDRQSNCTSFDGLDSVQSPDHIAHCFINTYMDHSAQVFNGDVARAYDPSSTREHHLHGGSVKNRSKLVNGDLDRDAFLAIFCNSNDGARQEGRRREGTRDRRRGPRAEDRAGPQPRV